MPKDQLSGEAVGELVAMRSLRLALSGSASRASRLARSALRSPSPAITRTMQTGAVVFTPLIGWSFIGTGLFAWWRRPENRFGALMTAVGFVWFLAALIASDIPGVFAIGGIFGASPTRSCCTCWSPSRPAGCETRWERFLVGLAYFDTTVMQLGRRSSSSTRRTPTSATAARRTRS